MRGQTVEQLGAILVARQYAVVEPECNGGGYGRTYHAVDVALRKLAALDPSANVAVEIEVVFARHVDIEPRGYDLAPVVYRTPVGHDQTAEAELAAQKVVDDIFALAAPFAVETVICRHDRSRTGLDAGHKRRGIYFVYRPLVHDRVGASAIPFGVVGQKVFQAGERACRLHALDIPFDHACGKIGIFAQILEVARALRIAINVHAGTQQHLDARRPALLAHGTGIFVCHFGRECRRQHYRRRKGRRPVDLTDHGRVWQIEIQPQTLCGIRSKYVRHSLVGYAGQEKLVVAAHHGYLLVESKPRRKRVGATIGFVPSHALLRMQRHDSRRENRQQRNDSDFHFENNLG